jgi:predicted XRE-type DNA-binding protein
MYQNNGYKQKEIAILFNTTQPVISGIKTRKYWKHI